METLAGWKTVLFNGLVMGVGLLDMFGIVLPENFAQDVNGLILVAIGVIGTLLRAVTTGVVGWKTGDSA